ncbi:MAG: hypothetical protein DIU62_004020 [Pseudomonadota bacterium]|nr:MAG: hypothetical protein DIU62_02480 [Pseudomonadota bacterium]
MDAAFIQQNQIIERYLMGKLPLKGAQDFERWCRAHPETVAELGLQDRINAALRLLDAAGEPLPWTEKPLAPWQKLPVFGGVVAVAIIGLVLALSFYLSGREKDGQIAALRRDLALQPLLPVQATRPIIVEMARQGPESRAVMTIGADRTELVDFKFDLSWSRYANFIVTIDRENQGRFAVLTNLAKDSNGHVRVALNSSALGPGNYDVKVEGLDRRRGTEPQAWTRFRVAR